MSLIIWKVELKLDCTNHCVLTAAGADSNDVKSNNVIFTIKDKKLYVPVVALSARDSQKLTKRLSKGFERSVYLNEYETKHENKITINEDIFSNQTLVELIDYFFSLFKSR